MILKSFVNFKCFLVFGLFLSGASPSLAAQKHIFENAVEPEASPRINLGRMNYKAYCAACHGETGGGTDKGPTFISRVYHPGHHGDGAFYAAAKQGTRAHHWQFGDMPPVHGITDGQIKSIIEYVRAIQQANKVF